jgi:hypothetical protein
MYRCKAPPPPATPLPENVDGVYNIYATFKIDTTRKIYHFPVEAVEKGRHFQFFCIPSSATKSLLDFSLQQSLEGAVQCTYVTREGKYHSHAVAVGGRGTVASLFSNKIESDQIRTNLEQLLGVLWKVRRKA